MKTTTFVLLLTFVLSACAPTVIPRSTLTPIPPTVFPTSTPEPAPTPTSIDVPKLSAELDAMFQKMVKANVFTGSVLVAQNGQIILSQGYNFADREKKIPNTAHTKFRIASITKQFTAMAIMMLQEQGKLNVQDELCIYMTDCPDEWKPITIHQLLTHTSGIPEVFDVYRNEQITSSLSLDKMIAEVKTMPLEFQPGDKFSYHNMGYILLGKIIEAVSKQSYEVFLQKNIFEPLQMSNTGFEHNQDDLAVGYNQYHAVVDPMNMWVVFSAGALYSTVEDLYRWDQALYTNQLVSQKTLDTIFSAHVRVPDGNGWSYGYGWSIGLLEQRPIISHGGSIRGFTSMIDRFPVDHATIIILINQEDIDPTLADTAVAKKLFGE